MPRPRKLRVLVAPDSFKGALGQVEAAQVIAEGLSRGYGPGLVTELCPLADGGEGSALLMTSRGGERQAVEVVDAYGRPRQAHWVLYHDVALVESSQGSPYCPPEDRPKPVLQTSSRGTGMLIRAALADERVREVWVGLGGTGSLDGGIGLLGSLGAHFLDADGRGLEPSPASWEQVVQTALPVLAKPLIGLADVLVPLTGPDGAVRRFGPQKGLAAKDATHAERALARWAQVCGPQYAETPGAGAAGGMGFALLCAGAVLHSGAQWWAEWTRLEERVEAADLVVTAEGRLDEQSLLGKVVSTVLAASQRQQKQVVILAGQVPHNLSPYYRRGVWLALPLAPGPISLPDALSKTQDRLKAVSETVGRMLRRPF